MASTTVERGNTHWTAGSNVNIDGLLGIDGTGTVTGSLAVSGLLSVSGTLNASGQINLSGSTGITGPLNVTGTTTIGGNTSITGELVVTGPTTLDGILDIGGDTTITGLLDVQGDTTVSGKLDVTGPMATKGTLSVEGVTTLKNDLNVVDGGVVKAGQVEIHPENGGNIAFAGASITNGGAVGFSFSATTQNAQVESIGGSATLLGSGSSVVARAGAIDLNAPKTWVNGQMEVSGRVTVREQILAPNTPVTSNNTFVPNLYMDSNGRIYKTTWTP
ncbi:hypothetical protein [Glutamicibacter sp. PS]|uniref:hypothetical protein n=1 Tax=Glutamicibacter sp. PS TaxID=3075634 RepID=UPI00283BB90E|nr:hypothetical protein [Glutamicibacter sp. PS]MDR4533205.1 hypothetical protein [Glutamicibacter sp. PS]